MVLGHFLVAALAALQTPAVQPGTLSLDEALRIAEHNAFAIQIQRSNVELDANRVSEAKANMGFKVSLVGVYTRFQKAQTADFGGSSVIIQPIDTKVVTASGQLPIDISGNLGRQVGAAEKALQAAKHTLQASVNDTRLNAKTAYFNVLRDQNLVDVAQQALTDAQERFKQAQQLFAGDQIAKVDVDRFQAQVSQSTSDLINAQNNLKLARNQFNFALARPIETDFSLQPIEALPSVGKSDFDLVDTAEAQRPEVLSLQKTVSSLQLTARSLEASMNPSLALGIQHQRNIDAQGFSSQDSSTVGTLTLTFPIFDSGLTRDRVHEAQQSTAQAQINLQMEMLSISQEVRNAARNLESAMARYKTSQDQVKQAEEVFRLAKVKQDAGAGTYLDVIDAETSLTQARNALVAAKFDYLTAFAQLQRAVGSDSLDRNVAKGAK